jgi:hypothetical protein
MSFEKIEEPAPAVEHPAYRAAKMIKELHEENIKRIDEGTVFLKDGVDCSAEIRAASAEQIDLCIAIMERAAHMDPKLWEPASLLLKDAEDTIAEQSLPEIGNYDHKAE